MLLHQPAALSLLHHRRHPLPPSPFSSFPVSSSGESSGARVELCVEPRPMAGSCWCVGMGILGEQGRGPLATTATSRSPTARVSQHRGGGGSRRVGGRPHVIDVQTSSARWADTNTTRINMARERHGPTCPVLVPGTARPPCPCWAKIPTRQPDTGTTRSNGRHGPRHDSRWIPATPPCDRWIPASPPFLYKGQRRPITPPTLTLVHLHAPSSLSSLVVAAPAI
jgi:hypothetical protein